MSVTITAASAIIEESVWLVEINPDPEGTGDPRPPQLFMPSGTPLSALSTEGSTSATAPTVVFSDRGWTQEPGDTGTYVRYAPRMLEPPAIEKSIPVYPGESRRSAVDAGELRLLNADGVLDDLTGDWSIAGRRTKITRAPHRRPTNAPRSTWVEVALLRASGAFEGTDTVSVPMQSVAAADLQLPANNSYAGTGGEEGGVDLVGVAKPRVFGFVRNVRPVIIDTTDFIFQVHDGAINSIEEVRDGGEAYVFEKNENTYASLLTSNPGTGKYVTYLGGGFLKSHKVPVFLTMDVEGSTDGGYASDAQLVAAQILRVCGGVSGATSTSFSQWPSGEAGVIIRDGNTEDAMNKLATGLGAVWWGANLLGEYTGGAVVAPEDQTESYFIQPFMLVDPPEEIAGATPPWWRVRVAYQELEVKQEGGDFVTDAPADAQEYYSLKRRLAIASDVAVRTRYPLAVDGPEFPGVLESKTEASTLALSLLAIYKEPRRTWSVRIGPRAGGVNWWDIPIGSVVKLQWPSIRSLAEGKKFLVRAISARGDYAELELWG